MGTQVQHVDPTSCQMCGYRVLQVHPGVIGSNRYPIGKLGALIGAVSRRISVRHERSLVVWPDMESSRQGSVPEGSVPTLESDWYDRCHCTVGCAAWHRYRYPKEWIHERR